MDYMDLSGAWLAGGVDFILPGSQCDNAYGVPAQEPGADITPESIRCLNERYSFRSVLSLTKVVEIPPQWEGKTLCFYAERVNMSSRLLVDGKATGSEIVSLSTPHRHYFNACAGTHELTLRLDNRNVINSDFMASGYSRDTQGYWCGAVGRIGIFAKENIHIRNQRIFAAENKISVYLTLASDCCKPSDRRAVDIVIKCFGEHRFNASICNRIEVFKLEFEVGDIKRWSEFEPIIHSMTTELYFEGDLCDRRIDSFGFRCIQSKNGDITINGRRIFLRGTTDCAIFPKTGYPPVDIDYWMNEFGVAKEYGLNNIRFHAWCPPEAAFCAADSLGMYVTCEIPIWLNNDVCALDLGSDSRHSQFMYAEGMRILKEYGNHPSFIALSNGNELLGDFEMLYEITTAFKAFDSRRLYTLTTNFDHNPTDIEDYICAYKRGGVPIRLHAHLKRAWKDTRLDYSEAPFDDIAAFSFEIGQHCQYPDFASIDSFDGNMRASNYEVIRNNLADKGFLPHADEYKKASGALACIAYKEEIESALRTGRMSGFQLLSLNDYPGQCTAAVGILDAFWRSKGIITPEQWREFCSERVVLMKADRFFEPYGRFIAELSVCDYSETPCSTPYKMEFYIKGECVRTVLSDSGKIDIPLDFADKNTQIDIRVSSGVSRNSYRVWVFEDDVDCTVEFTPIDSLKEKLEEGGDAVVNIAEIPQHRHGRFYPPFWSPAFFKTNEPNGLIIDCCHDALAGFPCGKYSDFQWYASTANGAVCDITVLGAEFEPIVSCVPNLYDNTPSAMLFEVKVGSLNILFCGFDFASEHNSARALKKSVYEYIKSGVRPKTRITAEQLYELIGG